MALMCFYAGFTEGKHLGIDNGGNMRVNSLRAVIVAWLNAFQRSRVCGGMNRSISGEVISVLSGLTDCIQR